MDDATAITECLVRLERDGKAEDELARKLDSRMRAIAGKLLRGGRRSPVWDTTGLSDDVLLKLLKGHKRHWKNREDFFAEATALMRWQLIDYAKQEFLTKKRGRNARSVPLDHVDQEISLKTLLSRSDPSTVLRVNELAEKLRKVHPDAFQVFDHHFFGQYTLRDIAEEILRISYDTVRGRWNVAKLFMDRELQAANHDRA